VILSGNLLALRTPDISYSLDTFQFPGVFAMNTTASAPYTEPWLRGTHIDVPPVARAVLHALELAADDAERWTTGLSDLDIHKQPFGLMSVASQIKHIAGSVDRLLTYAEGHQLSEQQLAAMKAEQSGAETRGELLVRLQAALDEAAGRVRALAGADLNAERKVGRKNLPTTMGGALIHVADHTQRHVGQLVTTAKLVKAVGTAGMP
jgi:uncharacterized damage-inducible protein DinB